VVEHRGLGVERDLRRGHVRGRGQLRRRGDQQEGRRVSRDLRPPRSGLQRAAPREAHARHLRRAEPQELCGAADPTRRIRRLRHAEGRELREAPGGRARRDRDVSGARAARPDRPEDDPCGRVSAAPPAGREERRLHRAALQGRAPDGRDAARHRAGESREAGFGEERGKPRRDLQQPGLALDRRGARRREAGPGTPVTEGAIRDGRGVRASVRRPLLPGGAREPLRLQVLVPGAPEAQRPRPVLARAGQRSREALRADARRS
jgi:hypothetical protein